MQPPARAPFPHACDPAALRDFQQCSGHLCAIATFKLLQSKRCTSTLVTRLQPKEVGLPVHAYVAREEVKPAGTEKAQRVFVHQPTQVPQSCCMRVVDSICRADRHTKLNRQFTGICLPTSCCLQCRWDCPTRHMRGTAPWATRLAD